MLILQPDFEVYNLTKHYTCPDLDIYKYPVLAEALTEVGFAISDTSFCFLVICFLTAGWNFAGLG